MGTALTERSNVWFTIGRGTITEVYYPRMDTAALRDVRFLVVDPDGRVWDEGDRGCVTRVRYVVEDAPAFEMVSEFANAGLRLVKRVIAWADGAALLVRVRLEAASGDAGGCRVLVRVAPHLENQGAGNCAEVIAVRARPAMLAWCRSTYACVLADVPFAACSVGYEGTSDGLAELRETGRLPAYERAIDGNVVLTAELGTTAEHVVAIGFGRVRAEACFAADLCLLTPYEESERRYVQEWHGYLAGLPGLPAPAAPHARLLKISAMVLRVHHGKLFPGGITASLAIPWGESAGDGQPGGYHLVWSRDLVHAAQALCALGDLAGAVETWRYLQATQAADGSWPQNFWLDGTPFWSGRQLDEAALPIHLAHRLWRSDRLVLDAVVLDSIRRALGYLVRTGPVTQQDRWEEEGGYSPQTLAAAVSALVLGASMLRAAGDRDAAELADGVADYWSDALEDWTFVVHGPLDAGRGYYERIHPEGGPDPAGDRAEHSIRLELRNRPPGEDPWLADNALIDGGFLSLVRYGLRAADDPRIVQSLAVWDALCRVQLPYGPAWYRYNGDGYGESAVGEPYRGWGQGHPWPLLAGERGHYELAAGRDPEPYLKAMEGAASECGMLPEQVWELDDIPDRDLVRGRPTGSAMPLVWAHSEFVRLCRSQRDGSVFDCDGLVRERYANPSPRGIVAWTFAHRPAVLPHWATGLRVVVERSARLVYSVDDWRSTNSVELHGCSLGLFSTLVDLRGRDACEFTFFWLDDGRWEGANFLLRRGLT